MFFEWLKNLNTIDIIFWCAAIPFTIIFIIQMIITLIGLGGGDADAHIDGIDSHIDSVDNDVNIHDAHFDGTDHDVSSHDAHFDDHSNINDRDISDIDRSNIKNRVKFKFFTIRGIVAFFTLFGWAGILTKLAGGNDIVALITATGSGLIVMFLIALIFSFLTRLSESGNIDINNAINCTGKVYLTIPAEESGEGKVQIIIQDSVREYNAITIGETLPTGTKIKVIGIIKEKLLVEKLEEI